MAVYFNPAVILGQLSQQNPFYNPFSPYPNVGGGIASTLQQLYALRQLQEQQRLKQEQWQKEYELQQKRLGLTEKGLELEEQRLYKLPDWLMKAKAISESTGKSLSETIPAVLGYITPEEELERHQKKEEITARVRAKYRTPTTYEQKKKDIERGLQLGILSKDEYKEAYKTLVGIQKAGGITEYQAMNARNNIARNVQSLYNNYIKQRFGTDVGKDVKRIFVKPKIEDVITMLPQGIDLRFPQEFNIAVARLRNGVGTDEDRAIVGKYIEMAETFKTNLEDAKQGRIKWDKKQILNSILDEAKKRGWDIRWFKFWLDNPELWEDPRILGYELK